MALIAEGLRMWQGRSARKALMRSGMSWLLVQVDRPPMAFSGAHAGKRDFRADQRLREESKSLGRALVTSSAQPFEFELGVPATHGIAFPRYPQTHSWLA